MITSWLTSQFRELIEAYVAIVRMVCPHYVFVSSTYSSLGNGSFRPWVVSAMGRFGLESFRTESVQP